jgi:hypothetical protein
MTDLAPNPDVPYRRVLRDFNHALGEPFAGHDMWAMLEHARQFDLTLVERVTAGIVESGRKPSGPDDFAARLRRAHIASEQQPHGMTEAERQKRDAECRPIIDQIRARYPKAGQ